MDAVIEILKGLDYSPLYVSLKTGIVATIFSFFLGLFAARKVIKVGPFSHSASNSACASGFCRWYCRQRQQDSSCFFCSAEDVRLEFCCMRSLVSRLYRHGQAASSQQQ